jgi:hypothetical protein
MPLLALEPPITFPRTQNSPMWLGPKGFVA